MDGFAGLLLQVDLETVASRKLTRANRNIGWIEKYCRVPEGRLVGQPVKLRPWQRTILKEIYGTPTRRAIVSFGRKNGKTALASFLLLLHLRSEEHTSELQSLMRISYAVFC